MFLRRATNALRPAFIFLLQLWPFQNSLFWICSSGSSFRPWCKLTALTAVSSKGKYFTPYRLHYEAGLRKKGFDWLFPWVQNSKIVFLSFFVDCWLPCSLFPLFLSSPFVFKWVSFYFRPCLWHWALSCCIHQGSVGAFKILWALSGFSLPAPLTMPVMLKVHTEASIWLIVICIDKRYVNSLLLAIYFILSLLL
jgi:hypothetical protein